MHSPSEGVNISNPSTEQVYQQQATPGLDYTVQRRDHVTAPPYQAHAMIAATPTASQHMICKFSFSFAKINFDIYIFVFSK